jgi:hypothetical protein
MHPRHGEDGLGTRYLREQCGGTDGWDHWTTLRVSLRITWGKRALDQVHVARLLWGLHSGEQEPCHSEANDILPGPRNQLFTA